MLSINLYVYFESASRKNKNNSFIGYTTTTLSRRLTENSAIKRHLIIKHDNSTNQLTSSDVRKILTDNTIIIYKNNNKKTTTNPRTNKHKRFKKQVNKIAFNIGTNILNIFNN